MSPCPEDGHMMEVVGMLEMLYRLSWVTTTGVLMSVKGNCTLHLIVHFV